MNVICSIAMAVLALGASAEGWRKHPASPVLGGPKVGVCFDANVTPGRTSKFDMWFSWRTKKSIAVSRSDDGVKWTYPEIVLRENPASGWEDRVNRSCVVFKDGVWHMWYNGKAKGSLKIGYAKSSDGVHFERVRKDPVLVPEADFEKMSTMNPYVRWDAKRGVWRMWYAAGETFEPNVICYAESADGIAWKKSPLNPIFAKGKRSWEKDRVGGCEVHPLPDGSYVMFYIGYADIHTARIGAAISKDGITGWKRLKSNPLVEPTKGTWDCDSCYKPSVWMDTVNQRWWLWYNGRKGSNEYIGCATKEGLDLGPTEE